MKKLAGSYKGKRKRREPPIYFQIECPGCGHKLKPRTNVLKVERDYVMHLVSIHKDSVEGFPPIKATEVSREKK